LDSNEENIESFKEILKEKVTKSMQKEVKRNKEIENLTGHVKFLYGILNNVIFTLNQHAVVINKELLPVKNKYLESKVMVKMFENIVSGTESANLMNLLTNNDEVSIFKSSSFKNSNLSWLKSNQSGSQKKSKDKSDSPIKVEQNITSNANNVIESSIKLSSGKQSRKKSSNLKPSDFSSGKNNKISESGFVSNTSKSKFNKK
jgi:hypothetical protein